METDMPLATGAAPASARIFGLQPKTALTLLVLLALALRCIYVFFVREAPYGDYLAYYTMAGNLFDGKGLLDVYDNQAFMNAGYPLFLYAIFLLTGKSVLAATFVNAVLGTLSVVLIYFLGAAILKSRTSAFVGAAIWAVYLPAITYCGHLAKENLMIPLLLAILLALVAYRERNNSVWLPIALGVSMALEALVGSALLAIVPVLVAGILSMDKPAKRKVADLTIVAVCAAVTLAPWLYRNYQIFGQPLLNTNGGFNMYLGNNPAATGMFVSIAETPLGPEWHELRRTAGELGANNRAQQLAIAYIEEHPGKTLALAIKKFGLFWYPPVHQGISGNGSAKETLARSIWLVQYLTLMPLAIVSLMFWLSAQYRARYPHLWILYASTLLYAALHMVFCVIFRYRLPAMPLVALLAAQGGWLLLEWWRHAYRLQFAGTLAASKTPPSAPAR